MLAAAGGALAQSPADLFYKAPPAVDQALRERINQFYQLHVDGKFRQAEALVAEESKDFFYSSNKPKYLKFEIRKIEYSENFTNAKATMVCDMFVMMPGFQNKPVAVPHPSYWKLVDGQWYWYVDPDSLNRTPFGVMKGGDASQAAPAAAPSLGSGPSVDNLMSQVAADKQSVILKREKGAAEEVRIVNKMPGSVRLGIAGHLPPGIEAAIDPSDLKAGETAVVTIRVADAAALEQQAAVNVMVEPINKLISIRVSAERKQ
jgi:hypothetical protein